MGLFTKKIVPVAAPLYTMGGQQTVLIVGLGNPGKKYDGTRHNIGFACIEEFASLNVFPDWSTKKDLQAAVTTTALGDRRVILIKPTTFMNLSGQAVQAVQQFYKISNQHMVVVYDELDLLFGQIRTQVDGRDAGHNGIKSLIEHCGSDFGRVRVGIGPKQLSQMDSADFVLAAFTGDEQAHVATLKREVSAILTEYVFGGKLVAETRSFIIET